MTSSQHNVQFQKMCVFSVNPWIGVSKSVEQLVCWFNFSLICSFKVTQTGSVSLFHLPVPETDATAAPEDRDAIG